MLRIRHGYSFEKILFPRFALLSYMRKNRPAGPVSLLVPHRPCLSFVGTATILADGSSLPFDQSYLNATFDEAFMTSTLSSDYNPKVRRNSKKIPGDVPAMNRKPPASIFNFSIIL
jgi:hypothetical protein